VLEVPPAPAASAADPRACIAQVRRWYHCIEVAPGVVTPGWFDLRPIVDEMPWPDVRGRRCLDVGTADGFLAFELERRGAAEVVAVDIGSHDDWDWEAHVGPRGPEYLQAVAGPAASAGFGVAHRLLSSSVEFRSLSVHDLSPETVGTFDVVVCGSLLLHLRDPLGALAAIASVCRGHLLCTNQVDPIRSILSRRSPLVRLDGTSGITQWWIPNAAGHRQMLEAAGFAVERCSRLYSVPFGPAHPPRSRRPRGLPPTITQLLLTRREGVPHVAALARVRSPAEAQATSVP
jgi:tRNA (mo5U34)-methyltransferase